MITDRDPEFIATITDLYWQELGRAPDEGGLASWLQNARNGWTGEQIRQALHDSAEGVLYREKPPVPVPSNNFPYLETRGIDFVNPNGERVVLCGTDQFRAFRMFLDAKDLGPLLDESHQLGFNMWRVFLMGSKAQNGLLQLNPDEPGFYEKLRPFVDFLNAAGIVVLATVNVDAQDILPSLTARQANWTRVANELRGSASLLSGGNEWHKNGFNPGELSSPDMLWSRGSDLGDNAPYRPYGSFAEFHPRRDLPASLMDTVASPTFIYGANELNAPLIIDEPPRMGQDGSGPDYANPRVCYKFARHYSTECAGAVFHSRSGQRSEVMDPLTRACAEAWQRGMKLG